MPNPDPIDPSAMYVCIGSFISKDGTYVDGEELPGADPGVTGTPSHWAPAALGTRELNKRRLALQYGNVAPNGREDPRHAARFLQPIPPERRVRAKQTLFGDGVILIHAGQVIDSEDALVKHNRKHFEPAPPAAA